jgi:hypothetical protein
MRQPREEHVLREDLEALQGRERRRRQVLPTPGHVLLQQEDAHGSVLRRQAPVRGGRGQM